MKFFAIAALGALASAVSLTSYDAATLQEIDSVATEIGIKEAEKDEIVDMAKDEGVTEEDVVSVFKALKEKAGELGEDKTEAQYKGAAMGVLRKNGISEEVAQEIVNFIASKLQDKKDGGAEGEKPKSKKPKGKKPKGEKPELAQESEGKKPKGEKPEDEKPEGEKPKGEKPELAQESEGEESEGEKPEGKKPKGEKPEGEKPKEPKWQSFVKAEFKKADTDESGEVDLEEFMGALAEAGMPDAVIDMIEGMLEADGFESFDLQEALKVTGQLLAHAKKELDAEPEDVKDFLTKDMDWDKVTQADLDAAVEYYDEEVQGEQGQGGKPQGKKPKGKKPLTA